MSTSTARNLIRFYNQQAGTRYQFSDTNCEEADKAYERVHNSMSTMKTHIVNYTSDSPLDMIDCFKTAGMANVKVTWKEEEKSEPELEIGKSLGFLEKVVSEIVTQTATEKIQSQVIEKLNEEVLSFIKKEYGAVQRKIEYVINGAKKEVDGIKHEKFETILQFVANDEPAFLTGPAGTGKNVLCQQIAKALDLDFYFSNAVTQEYKITGFTDAMGVYHETQFYKAFKNGGLFMLDEMDASIPEVLVILNSAIANRYFDFPAPIGYVEAHKDFRVVSAGNTFGHGADYEYVGRNQLDMASLDRFAMIKVGYDKNIELGVTNQNQELVEFCEEFRKSASEQGIQVIVSYRAMSRIAKLEKALGVGECLKTCLLKSLPKDDLNIICNNIEKTNKYAKTMRAIINSMEA